MVWVKDYELGIKEIDAQHKRIVNFINDLDDLANLPESNDKKENLRRVLGEVNKYIESHFGYEEAVIEKVGYPDFERHKKVHALFNKRHQGYTKLIEAEGNIAATIGAALKQWLMYHIRVEDAGWVKFIRELGQDWKWIFETAK
jgi:hemerythrin